VKALTVEKRATAERSFMIIIYFRFVSLSSGVELEEEVGNWNNKNETMQNTFLGASPSAKTLKDRELAR